MKTHTSQAKNPERCAPKTSATAGASDDRRPVSGELLGGSPISPVIVLRRCESGLAESHFRAPRGSETMGAATHAAMEKLGTISDVDESALTPVDRQTFRPYKGLSSYYNIGEAHPAVWSYPEAYPEVGRISNFLSFEPDIVSVHLDGNQLHLEPVRP